MDIKKNDDMTENDHNNNYSSIHFHRHNNYLS